MHYNLCMRVTKQQVLHGLLLSRVCILSPILCYNHISSMSNKINLAHKMNSIQDSAVATIARYIEIIVVHAHRGRHVRIVKVVKCVRIVKVENVTLEGNISNF